MEFIEKNIEMRAIKRKEIIDYFHKINGNEMENGRLAGDGWEAVVGEETQVSIGAYKTTAVIVTLRCRKEIFDSMYSKFSMEFFRAGG